MDQLSKTLTGGFPMLDDDGIFDYLSMGLLGMLSGSLVGALLIVCARLYR